MLLKLAVKLKQKTTFYKRCWPYMISIQKVFFRNKSYIKTLQFWTNYKLWREHTFSKQIEICYHLMVLLSIPLNKLPCSFLRSKTKFIVRPPHPQKNLQQIQKEKIQTTFWKNTASMKRAILPVVWTLQAHLVAVPKTLTIIVALWFRLSIKEIMKKQREEKKNTNLWKSIEKIWNTYCIFSYIQ